MTVKPNSLTKTYSNTYLYNVNNLEYDKRLIDFVMKGEELNRQDPSFDDIRFDIKRRQVSSSLIKVLDSQNVKLLSYPKPMPKAFKVFTCKDLKGADKTKTKVFIDCDVIRFINGKYVCNNIDIFISYLVSAMNELIYYADPKRLIMQEAIIKSGAKAFSALFTNIIDYLYKISATSDVKDKCIYLSAMYYQQNLLLKEQTDSVRSVARRISGLSERDEEILSIQMPQDAYLNIYTFINAIGKVLRLPKLTLDVFLEKWIFLYGVGTQFALEMYPAFATMMTNAYIGSYINNQKTIEKIAGRSMVDIASAILRTGSELAR